MLPCSLLAENIFLFFKVGTHPSIHNFGLEASPGSGNAISEGRPPLCNTSSEAGALDTGGTYRELFSDGSTGGVRGGGDQIGLRRGDDGVKNIRFFGEICCSRTIFARMFKVEIVLWY